MLVRAKSFKLLKRTRHVISEVRRVFQFREVLDHPPKESGELYRQLGVFMNASQDSCRDDFECSCPELEQLCQISLKHGAYGVRLTGTIPLSASINRIRRRMGRCDCCIKYKARG